MVVFPADGAVDVENWIKLEATGRHCNDWSDAGRNDHVAAISHDTTEVSTRVDEELVDVG